MTLQNSIFSITKISISMFIETIAYEQIKIQSISAPLGSTLTTTTYVINIYVLPARKLVFSLQLTVAQCSILRYRGMKCKH